MAPRSVRFGVQSRKLSNVGQSLDGWPKIYFLELLRSSEGTLSHWFRLHLALAVVSAHQPALALRGGLRLFLLMCNP
jgi:hypothetical protein